MRFANLFFAVSMATYFTMGSYVSVCWGQFYYTVLFGYVLCAVFAHKKKWVDEIIGGCIVGAIWGLYLLRPFVLPFLYDWLRFVLGISIFIFTFIYIIYIYHDWYRKSNS